MSFLSLNFLLFWIIVSFLYYVVPAKIQNIVLLLANVIFYITYNIPLFIFLFTEIIFSYLVAKKITVSNQKGKRICLFSIVFVEIFALLFFKYFNLIFTSLGLTSLFNDSVADSINNIIVPLGISFFSLKIISYAVDVYKGRYDCEKSPIDYFIYVSFFPQISSGPIERAGSFLIQLKSPRRLCYEQTIYGAKTILWGAFKKMVIADNLAVIVNNVYNDVHSYSGPILIVATIGYAIQLYCDFSGYSDIAVGMSSIMGFKPVENFKSPYLSSNIKEFWDRWHISLSSFFRDYIYFPLGGSRVHFARICLNVMIVFLVSGMWHGSTWQFIIWGSINGFYLVMYNIYRKCKKANNTETKLLGKIDCVILNFIIVCFAWIFFRANTISDAGYIISNMFSFSGFTLTGFWASLQAIGVSRATIIVQLISITILLFNDIVQYKYNILLINKLKSVPSVFAISLLLIAFIFTFGYYGPTADAQAFIYMNF